MSFSLPPAPTPLSLCLTTHGNFPYPPHLTFVWVFRGLSSFSFVREVAVPNSASRCHCRVVTESAPTKSQVRSFRFPWMGLLLAWLASVRSKTCASYLLETAVWLPLHFRYDVQEVIFPGSAIPGFHRPPAAAHCLMPQEVTVALQGWFNGI